ncbi:Crp/Fnr family transcriptional regulator [Pinisolibacter aquiterrae]|uniref:Crp/Fnr family transcriptional regulator n=1 Tax=Pinisolibacter aquiterrae TaxID=2815579 RepID=UPI001C3CE531|nr:Crp/Fnr family transcriptional regulator [Pinisolibacter aquiterrae]MCC8235844.1 Crp/Fnr family transcriptional regulator [Pinisolibacter aquiterrae]
MDVIRRLFPQESAATIHYRPRSYVFHQGTPVDAVHLVMKGTFVLERIDEDGRMAMFGTQPVGALLGWQDLLDGRVHRSSCQSICSSDLIAIPTERFETVLRESEELLLRLMQQAAAQTNFYEEHIFRLSTLDVPERLYRTLWTIAGSPEMEDEVIEVETPLMKRDIAALVGTSPESVSRGLRQLSKLKIAEFTERNTFRLLPNKKIDFK